MGAKRSVALRVGVSYHPLVLVGAWTWSRHGPEHFAVRSLRHAVFANALEALIAAKAEVWHTHKAVVGKVVLVVLARLLLLVA